MVSGIVTRPVVSDRARLWLAGRIPSDRYFAECRAEKRAEARRVVAELMQRQRRWQP